MARGPSKNSSDNCIQSPSELREGRNDATSRFVLILFSYTRFPRTKRFFQGSATLQHGCSGNTLKHSAGENCSAPTTSPTWTRAKERAFVRTDADLHAVSRHKSGTSPWVLSWSQLPPMGQDLQVSSSRKTLSSFPQVQKWTGFKPPGSAECWIFPFYYESCIKPLSKIFGKCSL